MLPCCGDTDMPDALGALAASLHTLVLFNNRLTALFAALLVLTNLT